MSKINKFEIKEPIWKDKSIGIADFRLKNDVPLIVPEVNGAVVKAHKGLIANPNCTTIQAVTALGGIYRQFGLEQIILTSFQATS